MGSMNKFLIGTGYYSKHPNSPKEEKFRRLWYINTTKNTGGRVVRLAVGNSHPRLAYNTVALSGNLGHINDLVVTKEKAHAYCGWSASMLALALIAYCDESDFIYKEQDCLAFGPWVAKMYEELGGGNVIFGSCEIQPAAQSLFLVKHAYIPEFVRLYLSEGPDNDEENLPEHKFATLALAHDWKRFSFGYDRDRPFNVADPVFYVQQVTPAELVILEEAGLL